MRWVLGIFVVLAVALIGAIYTFSDPDVPPAVLEAKYANAASRFVALPSGARVHLRDEGNPNGVAVILLHGSNASLHSWETWARLLGDEFRVITVDLPGHGLTGPVPGEDYSIGGMAAFTLAVADALGLREFSVGGNSMGGGVAARLALIAPDRVTRLILVSAGGMPTKMTRDPGLGFLVARTPVLNNVMRWVAPRSIFESSLKLAIADDTLVTPQMVDRYWELNRRSGSRDASLKRFATPQDDYIAANAAKIAIPVLILWGAEDQFTPLDMGEAYRKAIPNATLIVYKNVGHAAMEEAAEVSAADVRAFLRGEAIADRLP